MGIVRVVTLPVGTLVAPDGGPVYAVSGYTAPPVNGRPPKQSQGNQKTIYVSNYPDGTVVTPDGRVVNDIISTLPPPEPDVTAPTITSASAVSVAEGSPFSHALTANETVTWSKVGGADQALFSVGGNTLSMTAKDFEAPADANGDNAYVVTVRAADGSSNTADQTITVTVTNVAEGDVIAPTINSANPSGSYAEGVAIGGTLTANETVTWSKSGADAGLVTLNTSTGVWSLPTTDYESKTSYAFSFVATDAANNASVPQSVAITITDVAEGGGATRSASTITRTSANTIPPSPTFSFTRPLDWVDGDKAIARWSSTDDMASPTEGPERTLAAATTSYDLISPDLTSGPRYIQIAAWSGTRPGSLNWSNTIGAGDASTPTITSSNSRTAYQNIASSFALTADKGVTWEITGGFHETLASIFGQNLLIDAHPTVENLTVKVRAVSYAGVPSAEQTITIANQINTAASFDLGANVTGAARNARTFAPNDITVSGLAPGTSVSWALTNSFIAQKNGAGGYVSSGTVQNGDTLDVAFDTGNTYSAVTSTTLTIGSTTDTLSVTVMDDPAAAAFVLPSGGQPAIQASGATGDYPVTGMVVGAHAVVYPSIQGFGRVVNSVTLLGAGVGAANISLVKRVTSSNTGDYEQGIWTTPDGSPVQVTDFTVRVVWNADPGGSGVLIGSLVGVTTTVPTSSSSLAFPAAANPASTAAAVTVPAGGVGLCFGFHNDGSAAVTASTGTKLAIGFVNIDGTGTSGTRGQITRNITAGSWTPTFTVPSGSTGLLAATWGA